MIGNSLGPVDRTVSVLIDRSYPVVKAVYLRLKEIELCAKSIESIIYVSEHIDEIEKVQEAANALIKINESLDEVLEVQEHLEDIAKLNENIDDLLSLAQNYDTIISSAEQCASALETVLEKEAELIQLSATWYTPHVSETCDLSWTNNGGLENPEVVNIKGDRGDDFSPTYVGKGEERSNYDDEEIGTSFLDTETGLLYFKLSSASGDWSEGFQFIGYGIDSVLMDPDPVFYFDEIYGKSSGDIIGELVIATLPFIPDPTEVFENALT